VDLEKEKLEWTRPIQESSESSTTTRYHFDGTIITNSMDIPTHSGLYHHGEGISFSFSSSS
jgi:hypothetical protein